MGFEYIGREKHYMSLRAGRLIILCAVMLISGVAVRAQHQHDHSAMTNAQPASPSPAQQQELNTATEAMGHGHEHHMGPHMHMSALFPANAADTAKAQQVVDKARASLEKYKDVKAAEADGFEIFLPQVKQPMYHFTNYKYAMEAGWE